MSTTKTVTKKTETKKTTKKTKDEIKQETNEEIVENKEEVVKDKEKIVEEKAEVKKTFKEDDGILCRSITRGELICIGKKSEQKYIFSNHDDTTEIEVRDLNALKASKSHYLYDPLFIIEDEDFLSQPKWKDIKEMYEEAISNDINEIIDRPLGEFIRIISKLNDGYKNALAREVATRIHADEFDSLKKIKAVDDICGTDLMCLIS